MKSGNITLSFNKQFIAGYMLHVCMLSLFYDYWGMEGTIARLVDNWVSWKITVPLAIVGLICSLILTMKSKAADEGQVADKLEDALILNMKASIAFINHAKANGWGGVLPDEFEWIKEAPAKAALALANKREWERR